MSLFGGKKKELLALLARSLAKCFDITLVCLHLTVAHITLQLFGKPSVKCPGYSCLNNTKAPKRYFKTCTRCSLHASPASTMPRNLRQRVLPVIFMWLGQLHYPTRGRGVHVEISFCYTSESAGTANCRASVCKYNAVTNISRRHPYHFTEKKESSWFVPNELHSQTTREKESMRVYTVPTMKLRIVIFFFFLHEATVFIN